MKNKELVLKLLLLDPEAEIITSSDNFELNNATVAVNYIHFYENGSIQTRTFRDAFDGESYSKITYSILGGNIPVILIS